MDTDVFEDERKAAVAITSRYSSKTRGGECEDEDEISQKDGMEIGHYVTIVASKY